jgi:SNF2 family DNA or RNA helicase
MVFLQRIPKTSNRWFRHGGPRAPMSTARSGYRGIFRPGSIACAAFLAEVEAGTAALDLLRHPLLPYQREGMLHLAFGERALLADEMGLGKTVQAIAACELLARRKDIGRVLVVCPASLKAEWEEQIARFADRPTRVVFGTRPQRLLAYREPSFFTIVNYEQVLGDAQDMNEILRPISSCSTRHSG